jgi:hypothetical protein
MVAKQFAAANSTHVKTGDGQLQPPPQKRPKGECPMKYKASIVIMILLLLGSVFQPLMATNAHYTNMAH